MGVGHSPVRAQSVGDVSRNSLIWPPGLLSSEASTPRILDTFVTPRGGEGGGRHIISDSAIPPAGLQLVELLHRLYGSWGNRFGTSPTELKRATLADQAWRPQEWMPTAQLRRGLALILH